MIHVYIREFIGEFKNLAEADTYLDKNHYVFDENTQPIFEEVDDEDEERSLCRVCGEFLPVSEFELADDVCKWCDVTIRDKEKV